MLVELHEDNEWYEDGGPRPVFGMGAEKFCVDAIGFPRFFARGELRIVDPRESGFWVEVGDGLKIFPEWGERYFYENYLNDGPREIEIFNIYMKFIFREYPRPDYPMATRLHEKYCQCPKCDDYEEVHSYFGVIRCPKCFTYLNNPFADHEKLLASEEVAALGAFREHPYKNWFFLGDNRTYYPAADDERLIREIQRRVNRGARNPSSACDHGTAARKAVRQ